jgi:peptidyl-prolyl cis-trans isomerase A (cyclophilin A)
MRVLAAVAAALAALAVAVPAQAKAPAKYTVAFTTTKGRFDVQVQRAWAPRGADRFYELVRGGYYDGDRLFRVVPGFVVQFGINPKPSVSKKWANATIKDDPVRHTNGPGTIAFAATGAPNSRTTQVFVNLGNNATLDNQGFAPFGRVTHGMVVLRKLYSGYAGQPSNAQQQMTDQGEPYLKKAFPKLDVILRARIVSP